MLLYIILFPYSSYHCLTINMTPTYHLSLMTTYKKNDIVFAKCQNYPYWPGAVLEASSSSAKVLFYGEKSQATIDFAFIIPFNDDNYRKMLQEPAVKVNKGLRYSMTIAMKRFNKRKKGEVSSSEEEDFCLDFEPKKEDSKKGRYIKMTGEKPTPSDPHIELGILLNLLADEASSLSNHERARKFSGEQEARLRQLLDPSSGLLLAGLIDNRVIDKLIVVLKELDLWGLQQAPQLLDLHVHIRKCYQDYRAVILSSQFASIPLRESKREHVIQKVIKNKAFL